MNKLLNVSSSPHVRCSVNTQNLMLDVVIAMIPAAAFGVYNFGFHALLVLLVTSAVCVASEYVYEKLMHKPITIADGSALVTGMILALNMPSLQAVREDRPSLCGEVYRRQNDDVY